MCKIHFLMKLTKKYIFKKACILSSFGLTLLLHIFFNYRWRCSKRKCSVIELYHYHFFLFLAPRIVAKCKQRYLVVFTSGIPSADSTEKNEVGELILKLRPSVFFLLCCFFPLLFYLYSSSKSREQEKEDLGEKERRLGKFTMDRQKLFCLILGILQI